MLRELGSRVFVVTTKFLPPGRNPALEDTIQALEAVGLEYLVCDQVEENPSVEHEVVLTKMARDFQADLIIAIGGGSAIDAAKGIGILLPRLGENPYQVFFGHGKRYDAFENMSSMPVIAVPTTAGSGSEMTANLILTRGCDGKKMCIDQLSYATVAMLDPRYIADAPDSIFYAGILDALAHNIESYINRSSTVGNRILAETGFGLFRKFKDKIQRMNRSTLTMEEYGLIMLHAAFAGVTVGMNGSSLPHGMGYPLSHHKGQYHGYASCICLPAYLERYEDQEKINIVVQACGFSDLEEFRAFIQQFVLRFMDFSITEEEVRQWAEEFSQNQNRMQRHPGTITYADILDIYQTSFALFLSPPNIIPAYF